MLLSIDSARFLIFMISVVSLIYDGLETALEITQQKKPLPAAVSEIYDVERYRRFIAHEGETRRLSLMETAVSHVLQFIVLFSPAFGLIENITGGNVYLTVIVTYLLYMLLGQLTDLPGDYYHTFVIDTRYGLNRRTKREFWKDECLSFIQDAFTTLGILLLFAFCGEHIGRWTNGFSVGLWKAAMIGLAMIVAIMVFVFIAALVSYVLLKKKYTFTPLPDGELRNQIVALMQGCKKKVSQIYVYDESKKTTGKNAFLLKLLWHREFGIADNFMNENDERELLAVLSHEIGHLKHKKNFLDFVQYFIIGATIILIVLLIHNPSPVLALNAWIRESFQISANNYYILLSVYSSILTPILFATRCFGNYRSRRNEYEADMEAVHNGLGEELISTFEKLSSDELIDVNPHPLIEWLEYDHPGMYRRITDIRAAEAKKEVELQAGV